MTAVSTRSPASALACASNPGGHEAAVGINVVIDAADLATAVARATSGNFEAYLDSFSGSADIYQFVDSQGANDRSGYSSPRLDLILANSSNAQKPSALMSLYRTAA